MSEPTTQPPADLERALREMAPAVGFPRTPDLASAVRTRIAAPGDDRSRSNLRRFPLGRALAVAAVLALFAAALVVAPGFRSAVADRLGVHGITISFDDSSPTPVASPVPTAADAATAVGQSLLLGAKTSLADAARRSGFAVGVPALPSLGPPDEVYLRPLPDGAKMVSFIYSPAPGLPETKETGVGALLMQFPSATDLTYMLKSLYGDGRMSEANLGDHSGYWIEGTSTLTLLTDPSANCCDGRTRPSANVLLWETGGVTYRLESSLTEAAALAIARSVGPSISARPFGRTP